MNQNLRNIARRGHRRTVVIPVLLTALLLLPAAGQAGFKSKWKDQGPGPIEFAQVENVSPNDEAVGAIHTVAAHPTKPKVLYVGSVNGGIWSTNQAQKAQPKWKRLTDDQASSAIGALEFDPTDTKGKTLVAGIGKYSAFGRLGQERTGLLRTTDKGNNWTAIDGGGLLVGKNISGVAARGSTLVVSVDIADLFTFGNIGIFRSTDLGASFTQIAVGDGSATGLPGGVTNDLVGDPNNQARLYTSVVFADFLGGANGVYRSDDTGATWTKVSDPAIDALLISGVTDNVEFAVGQSGEVYAAIANSGRLAGLFRSGDAGATWTALDLPATGPLAVGIHPGGQASIHLSIVADPTNPNLVYIGGDRQPFAGEEGLPGFFPNSIGAVNFSGRLFRIDATQPPGSQAFPLTHPSTASNSSPHADSREMVFDLSGNLIEVSDGGIYKRTNPQGLGDWFSLNGDIQTDEQHDVSYDSVSDVVLAGTQDNDSPIQNRKDKVVWENLLSGDGGDTAVDDFSTPGISTRFNSAQGLQSFVRTFWDDDNTLLGFVFPALTVVGGGAPFVGQFVTPVEVNSIDATRLAIGGGNSVYESFDQGDTISEAGPGIVANGNGVDAVAYGGLGNPDLLLVGFGDQLYVRTGPPPAPLLPSVTYPAAGSGLTIRDIVIDPADASAIYLTNRTQVWRTVDGGASWTDVSGNIQSFDPKFLRAIEYVDVDADSPIPPDEAPEGEASVGSGDAVVVSSFNGIYYARESTGFTVWAPLGKDLPNAPIMDLDYDAEDRALVAGLLGRGAWKLKIP